MPGFDVRVNSSASGPWATGRAGRALHDYADDVGYLVAREGERMVQQRLRQVLRHPTGYYQSRISVDRAGSGYKIHDGGVIYGPWLEGTGSRNSPVTRFPGYFTFRRTKPLLDRKAPQIARDLLARYRSRGLI
ncbi:hypothetical protein [Streptomyces canus]|uniref:hypothetical protein n=1 Tax=Streptomyces canus TaxID=58343 RepID=UPI00386B9070|nr:hypothetical protein OH824_14260 [Streptomyces canus]